MLKYILFLSIIPLLLAPSFAYSENTFSIITDKTEYYKGETIQLFGQVSKIEGIDTGIIYLRSLSGNNLIYYGNFEINPDQTSIYTNIVGSLLSEDGTYIITANYDSNSTNTTFEYFDEYATYNLITIQIDKSEYYYNEEIIVNGTMVDVDWTRNTRIHYDVVNPFGEIIQSGNDVVLQNDGTFNFIIDTSTWSEFGFKIINVDIQDDMGNSVFYYSNELDKTNEANYERIMNNEGRININNLQLNDHSTMINSHDTIVNEHIQNFLSHDDRIDALLITISSLQTQIDGLRELVQGSTPDDDITVPVISDFIAISNNGTVSLSWSIEGEPITLYNLIYRAEIGVWTTEDVSVNATSYIITDLQNIEYDFKFSAENEFGESRVERFSLIP